MTGSASAPDDVCNAAMEAAGQSYVQNAGNAHAALEMVDEWDPTGLAGGVDQTLRGMEGPELQAAIQGNVNPNVQKLRNANANVADAVGGVKQIKGLLKRGVGKVCGAAASDDTLVRQGKKRESAERLARKAADAEKGGKAQNNVPFGHGVSVTTPESNAKFSRDPSDASFATRTRLEQAGFEVRHTPTGRDAYHHTVQLPKPVTDEVADRFNTAFGRAPKGGQ